MSVIVPLYDKEPYISRALDSIIAQTVKDWELLVVDDGSRDGGPWIVATDYRDSRVRLVSQENEGPGAARNRGLAEARGELVAFLDADDEWAPTYLEHMLELLDQEGASTAAATCGYVEWPARVSREDLWRRRGLRQGVKRVTPETSARLLAEMVRYMLPCTTVGRTAVLIRHGGFYEKGWCRYGEDAALWVRLLVNEQVVFSLQAQVVIHREASSLSCRRTGMRPIEPFLLRPTEFLAACPATLRPVLKDFFAIRAARAAAWAGYWGRPKEALVLVRRFLRLRHSWIWLWPLLVAACTEVVRTPQVRVGLSARGKRERRTDPEGVLHV